MRHASDRLRSDAALAALCGASPVEASSGQTIRHRLNRGGDRQGNKRALDGREHPGDPATISAVRPLRHGVIADFEVTEQMLRHFLRRANEFVGRVAHRTGMDTAEATQTVTEVFGVLRDSLPATELDYTRAALSPDYAPLLGDAPPVSA